MADTPNLEKFLLLRISENAKKFPTSETAESMDLLV